MCQDNYKEIRVKIQKDLSCTNEEYMKLAKIDACIADIVEALQCHGIDMRSSCCGHGKSNGYITLQDGRTLVIRKTTELYEEKKREENQKEMDIMKVEVI